jgi:hypothetical protein
VVPYDPLTGPRTVNIDLLRIPVAYAAGSVRVNVDSIELGGRPERVGNIIVWRNPFYLLPDVLNITMRFEVKAYNPNVLNYLSFVYDFQDSKNYKYASIMFAGQGRVYALNCSLVNGSATCLPPWPGVLIENYTSVAGEHTIKIDVDVAKGRLCLSLDSYKPVCFAIKFAGGPLGVRIDRFWTVKVKSARLDTVIRSYLDLRRFVKGNYTLVVAGTKSTSSTMHVTMADRSFVYISFKSLNETSYIDTTGNIRKNLVSLNASFFPEKYHDEIHLMNLAAKRLIFSNLTISSSQIIAVPTDESSKVCIRNFCFNTSNVEYLMLENSSGELKIVSNAAVAEAGIGFYASIRVQELHVPEVRVYTYFRNTSIVMLKGNLTLKGDFCLLAKRPVIMSQYATIEGVAGQSMVYPYLAHDLVVYGSTTFRFMAGDSSLLYFIVDLRNSKAFFNPPLEIYSEWESIPLLLKHSPWVVAILVLLVYSWLLFKKAFHCQEAR